MLVHALFESTNPEAFQEKQRTIKRTRAVYIASYITLFTVIAAIVFSAII